MKKPVMMFALAVFGVAVPSIRSIVLGSVAVPNPVWYAKTIQCDGGLCSDTAPAVTTDPTGTSVGRNLYGTRGYAAWVCPSPNCLLTADGGVDVYFWNNNPGHPVRWERNYQLSESAGTGVTGAPSTYCTRFPDHLGAAGAFGQMEIVANGLTVTGAGSCSLTYGIDALY